MTKALQSTATLLDIEPPVSPLGSSLSTTLTSLILITLLIILTTLLVRYYTSYRVKARRGIRQLHRSVKKENNNNENNNIDSVGYRDTIYQLSRLLSAGIGLNGITGSTTLPAELRQHHERWQLFTSELSSQRYTKQGSHRSSLDGLFNESLFWLKKWPC